MFKIAQEQESRLSLTKPPFYSRAIGIVPLPPLLPILFSIDLASILTSLLCTTPNLLAPLPMLDINAPSFVHEDETFPAFVSPHSYTNAGVYLRGRYLSCSSSLAFLNARHCASSRSGFLLFSLLNDHTSLSSFNFEDSNLPPLFRREFVHLCPHPSFRTDDFLA